MPNPIELLINIPEVTEGIERLSDEIEVALYRKTQQLTHMFAERVRANLSGEVLKERSGKLLATVQEVGPNATGTEIVASVQAGGDEAPYGIVHEMGGEKEYPIYPVNAKALAFEIDGKLQFFASVRHHPPLPKRSWFGIVEEEMAATWGDELQQSIGEVL
jgi:hypothetical protein